MITCRASPLTTSHIAGDMNKMADFASRSFVSCPDIKQFLTEFHTRFPLPQDASWIAFQFPKKAIGRVFSALLMPTSTVGSWHRLTKQGSVTGGTGKNFFQSVSTHTFKTWLPQKESLSFRVLLNGSGMELSDAESKSKWAASRQPSVPSPRSSNWLGLPIHCIDLARPTTMQQLQCKQRPIVALTLHH